MAAHVPGVWGIDMGQCALKAIRLEMKDGQVVATAFDYIEHPKILSQPDADPDQLTREALEQFLSRNGLRGDMVVISVPGQSGLARFVKLPPVEEKKIADIVRFEAKQQIPFPLEEVVWDFQKLSSGSLSGDFVETEIGLFAMKREMVNRALQQFKDVNVEVHVIQMSPLALCNFIAHDQLGKTEGAPAPEGAAEEDASGKKQCVVALDMGTDSSNLVITDGGKIIWQRPIPIGGNHFTRALTKDMKLTFAKAEHLKRNAAKSPELRKILASLKSVLNDFVGEVQRSLGYFTNTHRDAQIQYMVGLGNAFRLPGLKQFLTEKLQLDVRKLGKFERLTGDSVTAAPTFSENIMSFGVAYGLALQGLKQARLQTNLLPHEVRIERLVRGKKPWAVAAAAILLVACAGLAMAKAMENSYVDSDKNQPIASARSEVDKTMKIVAANASALANEEKRITDSKDNLVKLSAGTQERLNWQLLHEFINYALPLPNGDRLTERAVDGTLAREKYLTANAVKAFDMLEARRFPDPKKLVDKEKAVKEDQFIKKHLIQVNIEGIMEMYTDDLSGYFKKIHADGVLFGMNEAESKRVDMFVKDPSGAGKDNAKLPTKGWVVEVRGYTYNYDQMRFVTSTFVENLRNPVFRRNNQQWLRDQPKDVQHQIAEMEAAVGKQIGFVFVYRQFVVNNPEGGKYVLISGSNLRSLVKAEGGPGGGGGPGSGGLGQPGSAGQAGSGPAGSAPSGPTGGGGGSDAGSQADAKRQAWASVGEMATALLGGGGGGAGGGGAGAGGSATLGGPSGTGSGRAGSNRPSGTAGSGPGGAKGLGGGGPPTGGAPGSSESKDDVPFTGMQPRTEFVVLFVWQEPDPNAHTAAADMKK
jgi:type IV pilus assembly protein PilM